MLALAVTLPLGCVTRTVRDTVFERDRTVVKLRGQKKGGTAIERGFDHPVTIAPVRLAHILSRMDLVEGQGKKEERRPAVPTETLYTFAEGLSHGLAQANSSQEVVVQSIRNTKRFGLFDRDYLTSCVAYVKHDLLYVHFGHSEWEVPREDLDRPPEPYVGTFPMKFRLVLPEEMALVDSHSALVPWRDDVYRRPTRTSVTAGGRVVRRTILMEEPEPSVEPAEPVIPERLSPEALRALADLEEERESGEVTEGEYLLRRRRILEDGAGR